MKVVCVGCSCLCDDIDVEVEDGKIVRVRHACRIGSSIFLNHNVSRADPKVEGKSVDFDTALARAIDLIKDSKNLAIYGLDETTVEAQKVAIDLAKKTQAFIDNSSKLGELVKLVLDGTLKSTTLEDVKDYAYVIFYWGIDVHNSMPRHTSRYTYYPRGKKRQRGYEEDRFLVVVDVRRSHTAMLAKKNAMFIEVKDDLKLVEDFIDALDGKASSDHAMKIVNELKKSDFNVVFGGLGLKLGLKGRYDRFAEMVDKMDAFFIPADHNANSMGFFKLMFEETGSVDSYSFKHGKSSSEFSFANLLKNDAIDTAIIIGNDPLNDLPFEVARKLAKVNTIVIEAKRSFTSEMADVVIPSAISGVESGGTMLRHDGVEIRLKPVFEKENGDVEILKKIGEEL
jgi:formylmethanofuran dehydrogenase subunit B